MSDKNNLVTRLARTYEYRTEPFTLSSGEQSHEYLDCRSALSDPKVLTHAAAAILEVLDRSVEAVGGLTMGADPLAIGTSLVSSVRSKRYVRWFSVRKEAKAHGTSRRIEGFLRLNAKVAVLEDVSTSGASALDATMATLKSGMRVIQVLTLVDRGGAAKIANVNFDEQQVVTSVLDFADVRLIGRARQLAIKAHGDKMYGEDPYSVHLDEVVQVLADMCPYMPELFAAGWLHDVPEDTDTKVVDLRDRHAFPAGTVDPVDACTDGPGKNRKERKERPMTLIPQTLNGVVIKLADRIANIERSQRQQNHDLLKMYRKEHDQFVERLRGSPASFNTDRMWERLDGAVE